MAKVLADLLTITMIRSFRERPLALFAGGAAGCAALSLVFAVAALGIMLRSGVTPERMVVLPGAALLWLGLAVYLLMLGLVGEIALRESRDEIQTLPLMRETFG